MTKNEKKVLRTEKISEIGIRDLYLYVHPESENFSLIYRSACGISWDANMNVLCSPKSDKLFYAKWFHQILNAVKSEYGIALEIAENVKWTDVPEEIQKEITQPKLKGEKVTVFAVYDRSHCDWWGEFPSYESALEELKRRSEIPWDSEPNKCPCTSWETCDRHYQIMEFSVSEGSSTEISKESVLEISARGVVWLK